MDQGDPSAVVPGQSTLEDPGRVYDSNVELEDAEAVSLKNM